MDYNEIVEASEWDGTTLQATLSDDWGQGRTIFGGLTTGLALYATGKRVADGRRLRTSLTSFVNPIRAGDVSIATNVLRAGRNVTHVEATISQQSAVCTRVLACYGADRASTLLVEAPQMIPLSPPEQLATFPFVPNISPEFARYIDYRWKPESVPYLGKGNGTSSGWIRLHATGPLRADHLALIVDAWPSSALAMMKGPVPVSSLTWNLELLHQQPNWRADDWWAVHASIDTVVDGYVHGSALVWSVDGVLVARSQQLVSIYSRG